MKEGRIHELEAEISCILQTIGRPPFLPADALREVQFSQTGTFYGLLSIETRRNVRSCRGNEGRAFCLRIRVSGGCFCRRNVKSRVVALGDCFCRWSAGSGRCLRSPGLLTSRAIISGHRETPGQGPDNSSGPNLARAGAEQGRTGAPQRRPDALGGLRSSATFPLRPGVLQSADVFVPTVPPNYVPSPWMRWAALESAERPFGLLREWIEGRAVDGMLSPSAAVTGCRSLGDRVPRSTKLWIFGLFERTLRARTTRRSLTMRRLLGVAGSGRFEA
jgi:hypothetical protein